MILIIFLLGRMFLTLLGGVFIGVVFVVGGGALFILAIVVEVVRWIWRAMNQSARDNPKPQSFFSSRR